LRFDRLILIALEPAEAILIQEWQALGDAAGRSVIKDPARAICGIATVFSQPSPNDGRIWKVEQFEQFLDLETAVPLRVDHGPLITNHGVIRSVGMVRRFATVTWPTHGLLIMAEVDDADGFGDQLLHDITAVTTQTWLPHAWGLSLGALVAEDAAMPFEVSVTRSPAFEDAKILGVGEQAMNTWRMLTERRIGADQR
jgi:hypothetical protein